MSDRLALIDGGRIVLSGSLEEIRDRHFRVTVRTNGAGAPRVELLALPGVLAVRGEIGEQTLICAGDREAIAAELGRSGLECVAWRPASLDEIFFARSGSDDAE